jgi:hypothetical protein
MKGAPEHSGHYYYGRTLLLVYLLLYLLLLKMNHDGRNQILLSFYKGVFMKSLAPYIFAVISIFALSSSLTIAQDQTTDLAKELSKVGTKNISNYVSPIFSGFASDLNSAFYHSADLHDVLGFDIGVKFGLGIIKDADRKYDFITPDSIGIKNPLDQIVYLKAGTDYDAVVTGVPTAVGDKKNKFYVKMIRSASDPFKQAIYDSLVAHYRSNNLFQIPNGFDLPAVPLIMPQAAIGLPFGLEVMVRFIPTVSATEAGKFNYMGFGLRYDIDKLLRKSPVDIAVHFMTQKMNFKSKDDKDIFSATGTAYGIEASKRLVFLTVYGGFQLEKSSFTLAQIDGKFTTPDGTETPFTIPEMTFEGKNKSRFTLGVRALLALVSIHAEYSVANTPVFAAGIGVSLR